MGDVLEYLVDGTSGLAPGGVEGACIVTGVCSLGEVGKGYLLGKSSDLEGLLGVGPLVDRLRDVFATGGQEPVVIAVPVTGLGGSFTPVEQTGTGPVVTVAGTAKAAADVIMKIVKGGTRNVGTYQLTVDGGDNWGPEKTIPVDGLIAVGSSGAEITVPATPDMVAGDTCSFEVLPPAPSINAVISAIDPLLSLYDVEFVYIVGASGSADWAAMGVKADEMWNIHRPTFFICETRLPAANETIDDWTAAMLADRQGYAHRFVQVCAAYGEVSDSTGKRITRNWAGLAAGRNLAIPVQRALGRVRDGGISQGTLPEEYTEAHQQQLEDNGFLTAKHYAGLRSAYWGDAKTLADVTSDYQYTEVLRTVFKAVRKARIAALKSMYDEAGDPLAEGGAAGLNYLQANIEMALDTMVLALPQEMAGYDVAIPPGQDIVNNGVGVEMSLVGLPIIRSIKLFASYSYAGSKFDPRLQ